jgi:tRNA-dihydrouridine synthase A
LRYAVVERLQRDFPMATIVLNGGLASLAQARAELARFDGVMLGRAAYHEPYLLAEVDAQVFDDPRPSPTRAAVVARMEAYLAQAMAQGTPPRAVLRHMLGLYHGQRGGRHWRRLLSDPAFIERMGTQVLGAAQASFDPARDMAA